MVRRDWLMAQLGGLSSTLDDKLVSPSLTLVEGLMHRINSEAIEESDSEIPTDMKVTSTKISSYLEEVRERILILEFSDAYELVSKLYADIKRCGLAGKTVFTME